MSCALALSVTIDIDNVVQQSIRAFLKVRRSYDVLPLSFRLIIFDTNLLVNKSLAILIQNGEIPLAV